MDEKPREFFDGERRLTLLLVGHWQEARDGRRCPKAGEFTALVSDELLADCFTYEPQAGSSGARGQGGWLRDIGAALARASGTAATEMALADAPPNSLLGVVGTYLDRVFRDGTPVLEDGEFEDAGGARKLYRATLLPLENDAGEVALVIAGARSKAG